MGSALLSLNLIMYVVVAVIAGWAINYSIDESRNSRKCAGRTIRRRRAQRQQEIINVTDNT